MRVRGPNNVGRAAKQIQHCCATLRWKLRVKSLTGFKLCATTPYKHVTGCANGRNGTCNNVAIRLHGTKLRILPSQPTYFTFPRVCLSSPFPMLRFAYGICKWVILESTSEWA